MRACFRLSSASRSSGDASVDVPACSEEPAAEVFLQEPLLGVSLTDDPDDAGVTTSCAELGPALCGVEIAMRWSAGGDGAAAGGLDTCILAAATRFSANLPGEKCGPASSVEVRSGPCLHARSRLSCGRA